MIARSRVNRGRRLLWLFPLGLLLLAALVVLALPKFVASGYHRTTIENLASSITGRDVHIDGRLSLALLPHPQFIASDVSITSPDKETITAASLTLDIAPLPLLRGLVRARSITLQSPHIAVPWPLPGGAAAIAPPRWLAASHAQIRDGQISLGAIIFNHVSADVVTGGDGAFSVAGSGEIAGHPLNLALSLGAISAVGSAAVTLAIQGDDPANFEAHVSGSYDSSSTLTGQAIFAAGSLAAFDPSWSEPLDGTADLAADGGQVRLANLQLRQGAAALSGSATLRLARPSLMLLLSGRNLVLPVHFGMFGALAPAFAVVPVHLSLDASDSRIVDDKTAIAIPHLHGIADFGATGATITSVTADLPGASTFWASGTLSAAGRLRAKTVFDTAALTDLLSAYGAGIALPANWQAARLAGDLSGTGQLLGLTDLTGSFGPARATGNVTLLQQHHLMGALHFDQLDLTPFTTMPGNSPSFGGRALDANFEITADRASIGKIPLQHLLIDAALGSQLTVRRLTASLYGGIAATSFMLAPDPAPGDGQTGLAGSARAVLSLPSAEPLAELLPASLQPPPAIGKVPLALSFLAAGPADALATSASLDLGAITITAAPRIDLTRQSAAGAFTLRHPNAIAAFKAFGLKSGLAWPGAGSIALRANMLLSPTQMGFSDFVLSMGDLTANGRLIYGGGQLNGQIDADTLALPPIPADFIPPWPELAQLNGRIDISADQVLASGDPIFGPVAATLELGADKVDLAVSQAGFGNGVLRGEVTARFSNASPPARTLPPSIAAKFSLSGADGATLAFPIAFPITLPRGSIDAAADITATGYDPRAWLATIAGSASLAVQAGALDGFDLPGIVHALSARGPRLSMLRSACLSGTTAFAELRVSGSFTSGIYTLTSATLQSPAGTATATGIIDFPDTGLTLNATMLPNVPAPPLLALTIAGSWAAPRRMTGLKQALAWRHPNAK